MATLRFVTAVLVVVVVGVFAVRRGHCKDALQGRNDSNTDRPYRTPLQSPRTYKRDKSRYKYTWRGTGGRDISQASQILYTSIVPLIAVLGILTVLLFAYKQRSLLLRVHSIVRRLEQGPHIYTSLTGAREPSSPGSYTQVHYPAAAGGDNPDLTYTRLHTYTDTSQYTHVDTQLRHT
ncbi:uncharacterized protein [Haliotis asinina]|uniref:uncharacterized protein n=1 Tax=Haliotis asinina TaxID=109174 RepID=UPI003531A8A4